MLKYFSLSILVVVSLALIVCAGKSRGGARRTKTKCPDTCQLKRKIGKIEASFQDRLTNLELHNMSLDLLSNDETKPSYEYLNLSSGVESYLEELRGNLSRHVQGEIDQTVGELKATLSRGQNLITATRNQVNNMIKQIPVALSRLNSSPTTKGQLPSSDLMEAVEVMNITIRRLKLQNSLLVQRTLSAQETAEVLREQNRILSSQNRGLRLHSNSIDRRTLNYRRRIESLEIAVNDLNETRQLGLRWAGEEELMLLRRRVLDAEEESSRMAEQLTNLENMLQRLISSGGISLPVEVTTSHPQPDNPPNDCQELYEMGYRESGIYSIRPWQSRSTFQVYCDQNYFGGGWTLIQRRRDGSVDFNRLWDDYAQGFGELDGEFWLGNEKIHQLTNQDSYRLHIVMMDWDKRRVYSEYAGFRVSSSRDYYSIRFGRYDGTAGDGLRGTAEDGSRNLYLARFSTSDLDNDSCRPCYYEGASFESCARLQNGGWWYRACADANLNGRYIKRENMTDCPGGDCFGLRWDTWHDEPNYSLRATLMMVKRLSADAEN